MELRKGHSKVPKGWISSRKRSIPLTLAGLFTKLGKLTAASQVVLISEVISSGTAYMVARMKINAQAARAKAKYAAKAQKRAERYANAKRD